MQGERVGYIKAKYSACIFTTYFLHQVLTLIAFNYVWQPFGNYCGPNVFDIRLRTVTESTWKILKLDWKTPGIFPSKRVGTLFYTDVIMYPCHVHSVAKLFGLRPVYCTATD